MVYCPGSHDSNLVPRVLRRVGENPVNEVVTIPPPNLIPRDGITGRRCEYCTSIYFQFTNNLFNKIYVGSLDLGLTGKS